MNDGKDLELVFDEGRRLLFRGAHEVVIDLNFGDLMGAPLVFEVRRGGVDAYEVQFGGAPDGAVLVKANDVEVDRGS